MTDLAYDIYDLFTFVQFRFAESVVKLTDAKTPLKRYKFIEWNCNIIETSSDKVKFYFLLLQSALQQFEIIGKNKFTISAKN